ncbi:ATP-binding domain-containing protein [Pseudomonas monsensis]|uniref:ATP-binding domain-containing protein n=1 Tax=Pseudomonas monsensis TaxID=2745509 RepID=A0ABT3YWQ7_9PSED|nr:ATP-binding domain-containing protein [Pseudomonas monsensis]MCY0109940.1 ATP-binding domain-containing protein [Pseudomonas monsensis]
MESPYFFCKIENDGIDTQVLDVFCSMAEAREQQTYIIQKPLSEDGEEYAHDNYLVYLSPKKKILIFDFSGDSALAGELQQEFVEDLIAFTKKFKYNKIMGRSSAWRDLVEVVEVDASDLTEALLMDIVDQYVLTDPQDIKKSDLLISLLTGSINDIEKVKADIPVSNLEKVKQKIMLFDRDQTRFIYSKPDKKIIRIQGLSGTGKTELLLHKLKEIYVKDPGETIFFTCNSKILASSLRSRIPAFFNFMKVDEQIEWQKRLWCTHAWGSEGAASSGMYAYICSKYDVPFYNFQQVTSLEEAARRTLPYILKKYGDEGRVPPLLSYILIDESQDFGENFFKLCELAAAKHLYIAGDIFQSIFDTAIGQAVGSDYLLSKCYRTDPRTLMAAHAIGMGLFEQNKLQWLDDEEWTHCGYIYHKQKTQTPGIHSYSFSRKPLRRFEDVENSDSLQIVMESPQGALKNIMEILGEIVEQNPSVRPDDIGVVVLNNGKAVALLADRLQREIYERWNWQLNKAYETKTPVAGSLFISNKNHVKGLEFPFVICVSDINTTSLNLRNSLYMVLTRSFLKSYLVVNEARNRAVLNQICPGIETIRQHDIIVAQEPTAEEKERIRTRIMRNARKLSYMDTFIEVLEELGVVSEGARSKLISMASSLQYEELYTVQDIEEFRAGLRNFLLTNRQFVERG